MSLSPRHDYWSAVVAQFHRSGLTQADFCRTRHLSVNSFRQWLYRLRHRRSQRGARHPSMRGALSSAAGADFVSRASRTSPSPSASVDLAHLRPVRGRVGRATRNTSSEPEAEGEFSPSMPAVYEALADVT